jgi:hypothetical protein
MQPADLYPITTLDSALSISTLLYFPVPQRFLQNLGRLTLMLLDLALFRHLVGLCTACRPTQDSTTQRTKTNMHALSGIRSQSPSGQYPSLIRPRHCDGCFHIMLQKTSVFWKHGNLLLGAQGRSSTKERLVIANLCKIHRSACHS